MKIVQTIILIAILTIVSCKNNTSTQKQKAQSENEVQEFTETAEQVANLLQPQKASVSFELDGVTYSLQTKDINPTIIPFTHYKPKNEEEGEMTETSLIWMQGKDANNQTDLTFSITLYEKFGNGNFSVREGEVAIEKEGKKQYYSIKDLDLNISNFSEKKFNDELSAYSMEVTFRGELGEFGPGKKTYSITNGEYAIKY